MKLNADIGEGVGNDANLIPWISMANIACGYHAGDMETMEKTVRLAVRHGVMIGAHPGYKDRVGFGRRSIPQLPGGTQSLITEQIEALEQVCQAEGTMVSYIKPHGALYHDMMSREDIYEEILQTAKVCGLSLMIQSGQKNHKYQEVADRCSVPLLFEVFADRAYTSNGELLSRGVPGSVYICDHQITEQVVQLKEEGNVTSVDGAVIPLKVDSVCLHGDNEASVCAAKNLYQLFQ